jgi:hypothetical protein
MSDEPTLKTRTDVLDLVIGFIVEHEKRMNDMVERLERIADKLAKSNQHMDGANNVWEIRRQDSNLFTLSINNPEDYENIKSVKVEWETGQKEFTTELSEIEAILNEMERKFKPTEHL